MALAELDSETFRQAAAHSAMLVAGFCSAANADSAGLLAILEGLSARYPDACFARIDLDREPALGEMFGVSEAPTLLIMRDEIVLYCDRVGVARDVIETLATRARALDMQAVRAALAEQRQGEAALAGRRVCPTAWRAR